MVNSMVSSITDVVCGLVCRTRVQLPYVDRARGFTVEERLFGTRNAVHSAGIDTDDATGQRLGNGLRVVVLSTSIGLQVIWDGGSYLELSIPPQYKSRVCGLCGTYYVRACTHVRLID